MIPVQFLTTCVLRRTWEWITLINTIYIWNCLVNLVGNTTAFFLVLTYLNSWQFWKDSNQNVWKHYTATIANSLKNNDEKNQWIFLRTEFQWNGIIMFTEHAALSFYRVWASRNVGLPPVSVSDGVEMPTSTSERAYIVYERQRTQQSETGRRATATKRVASVSMPQLNRHLISLDRTAIADERSWACLGVRQPWYHKSESRIAKFYGVRLWFSSWRCHDSFLTKTANV